MCRKKKHYVYMVRCSDQTLYTGWTVDLKNRIKVHNAGRGAKYTKARRPVKLVYYEKYDTKSEALKREYAIKKLSKAQKEKMIEEALIPLDSRFTDY